jgi:hypothetical protein
MKLIRASGYALTSMTRLARERLDRALRSHEAAREEGIRCQTLVGP